MQQLSSSEIYDHPSTPAVREQLARIYEETSYVVAGTLGRTAVCGKEPNYWYRRNGDIRDIDVHDPYRLTSDEVRRQIELRPLPIDDVSRHWLRAEGNDALLTLPRDNTVCVTLPGAFLETETHTLLGVPVRTFRPEVMLGLNLAVPYDRISQRRAVAGFTEYVVNRPGYDPTILEPFQDMAEQVRTRHPEYVRGLFMKDVASYMPRPILDTVKVVYRTGKRIGKR